MFRDRKKAMTFRTAALATLALVIIPAAMAAGLSQITRVSTDSAGKQVSGTSRYAAIAAYGQYVVFQSWSGELDPGDTNGKPDIYLKNVQNGSVVRVSTGSAAEQAYGSSEFPAISADGSRVVFSSDADNLVEGDTNEVRDVFVKDIFYGTTTRVSVSATGVQGNGASDRPSISADGRFVAFASEATELVDDDSNRQKDIFVKDLQTGDVVRASTGADGRQGLLWSDYPSISADGGRVAFLSFASNLVPGDSNGRRDVFVKDLGSGAITRASTGIGGSQGGGDCTYYVSLSPDGRYAGFRTTSSFDTADTNGTYDIYMKDTQTDNTVLVSSSSSGAAGNGASWHPSVSSDGRYVAFFSNSSNLVDGDTNGRIDVFVKDTLLGATHRMSMSTGGQEAAGGSSEYPSISADGAAVAFESSAANLVYGDSNHDMDVFVTGVPTCESVAPDLALSQVDTSWASMADYTARLLSVDFDIANASEGTNLRVLGTVDTGGVTLAAAVPLGVGADGAFTLVYHVPDGVTAFKTTIYVTIQDSCGYTHEYPGPYPFQ